MTETKLDASQVTGNTLKSVGAWQTGHFLLTSGKHSDQYMQCQKVMQYPRLGNLLADLLIEKIAEMSIEPDIVIGPALGAVHWELFAAQALERFKTKSPSHESTANSINELEKFSGLSQKQIKQGLVRGVFAEKLKGEDGSVDFEIRRGIELDKDLKVLVVEDVTTTGGSARKVVELTKRMGLKPVAVGAVVDRSGGTAKFDVPFISLLSLNLKTYDPEDCPLCKDGSKPIKPGSSTA